MFSVGIGQIDWVIGTLHPYFLVYFLAVFMNLVSMNLKSAYQEEIVNVIQVSRRIIVFNVVSVVILSIAIAGLVVLFSNVNFGWLETVLRFVLMPILQLGTFFSNRLRNKAIRNQNENGESNAEVGDNIEKMREDLRDEFPVDTNSNWDQYIEWAFIIIVILGIVAFAYYMTKGIEKRRRNKQNFDNDEVRETLLTASYLKKHLEDQWAKVSAKIDSVLGRNKEVLPRLRDVYKRYLKYIAHKGISISDAMTPNEILAKDQFKRGDKKTAKELTALYNAYRYGGLQDEYIDDEVLDAFEHAIESKEM